MTTALYRRYRPETFGEMIGQSQVTDPLMTALRGDRVGHAYLFSGPRGCGKTTSARILARCLNCAAGPTDTPCGTCDSCVELSRGGGGSLDVVEIDAASHNGVDDARDLRERAIFAPARDRFKIFILDEAHMVTAQGFNALLKLVEEPPAHVKFIFATTEPEKVIGTIRSRTHHYPFRLVAPAAMLEYVEQLCAQEQVQVEPGVLNLVVRAGGGSPRDTLSLLDQLIAGSENGVVTYERSVALLGYTHAELLDEVVDAFGARDAGAAFAAVDRVVQTGQDPRRFVDDLLERLRDLIIVAATGDGAAAVLRGIPADELERMGRQATGFGTDRLSRIADLVVGTLDDMSGATSPRLQLELMVARVLAAGDAAVAATATGPTAAASSVSAAGQAAVSVPAPAASPAAATPSSPPRVEAPPAPVPTGPISFEQVRDAWVEILRRLEPVSRTSWMIASAARPAAYAEGDVLTLAFQSQADVTAFKKLTAGKGPSEDLRGAIQSVLGVRVKYVARHDADPSPPSGGPAGPDAGGPGAGGPGAGGPGAGGPGAGGPGASGPGASGPAGAAAGPPVGLPPARSASLTSPVTEWAVASIPADVPSTPAAPDSSVRDAAPRDAAPREAAPRDAAPRDAAPFDDEPPADDYPPDDPYAPAAPSLAGATGATGGALGLAVDDEPEDAASAPVRTLTAQREGDVIAAPEPPVGRDDDPDDIPPPVDADAPVPPRAPVAVERPANAHRVAPAARAPRASNVERVGEAVVRQMLGATFVREEPYTPPTRFN